MKTYWRCTICGDIHFGVKPPHICPTCNQEDKYEEIAKEEALKII